MEIFYNQFIERLNSGRGNDLEDFVCCELSYNGKPMTLLNLQEKIKRGFEKIPGMRFSAHLEIATDLVVAAKLDIMYKKTRKPLGFLPVSKNLAFTDDVFYGFTDGKISEMWSRIDPG